jgi:hypothetical protein
MTRLQPGWLRDQGSILGRRQRSTLSSQHIQTVFGAHLASCPVGTRLLPWVWSWLLTSYLMSSLRIHGAEPPLPYMSSWQRQSYPCNRLWRPIGLWDVKGLTFSRQLARLSALRAGHSLSPGGFLVLISVRGWLDARAIMWLEGLGQLKNPLTSSGTKPTSTSMWRTLKLCGCIER